jgi:hypothetical protein
VGDKLLRACVAKGGNVMSSHLFAEKREATPNFCFYQRKTQSYKHPASSPMDMRGGILIIMPHSESSKDQNRKRIMKIFEKKDVSKLSAKVPESLYEPSGEE